MLRPAPGNGRCADEEPQPEGRVELRRAVHLEAEPRAPPVVGERLVELCEVAVVRRQLRRLRRVVEHDVVLRRRRPDLADASCRASRAGRSGTRRGSAHPRSGRGAPARRRRRSAAAAALPRSTRSPRTPSRPGEQRLRQLLPVVAEHAARVRARVRPDAFPGSRAEPVVVRVPSPEPVGEAHEVLVHPRAALPEEGREIDPVGAVRLLAEQVPLDGVREPPRRRAVVGADDVVDRECAEERQARAAAARDGEVVEAHEVDRRPGGEDRDGDPAEGDGPPDADAPGRREHERQEADDEERLVRRAGRARGARSRRRAAQTGRWTDGARTRPRSPSRPRTPPRRRRLAASPWNRTP